ncbi:hypothetical protein SADUNF_Sadunf04G0132600 [Salix dunnii]|uniref:Histidine-containing phosphotransfer protein n=1 Tax=Salix dunnii TaxID=1413687 RepID=A0A835MZH2_9ROSI|nr:hypothetical protein SADUNF_Sadunf04G0132600 [Salix dunnii]
MEGSNVWQEQRNFVKSLHEQGILDSHFDDILDLPRESPQFVIDLVGTFCSDAENAIAAMIRYLKEPDINYPKVMDKVHLIRGASSCIGGHRMALACRELRYACEDKDKDRVLAEKLLVQATFSAVHPLFSTSVVLSDIHDDAGFLDNILSVILKAFFTFSGNVRRRITSLLEEMRELLNKQARSVGEAKSPVQGLASVSADSALCLTRFENRFVFS